MLRKLSFLALLLSVALPSAASASECAPAGDVALAPISDAVSGATSAIPRRTRPIVTIDGPAGAGKSTMARRLSAALGYVHVDSGALFRAITLAATRDGIAPEDPRLLDLLARIDVSLEQDPVNGLRVLLDGEDVSTTIRTQEITIQTPSYAKVTAVFDRVLDVTRALAERGGAVLEGRSTGTVTFPDAEVKFWLDAPLEIRARRRHADMVRAGEDVTYEEVRDSMAKRDHEDEIRVYGALRRPEGAIEVSSAERPVEETAALMVGHVREAEAALASAGVVP